MLVLVVLSIFSALTYSCIQAGLLAAPAGTFQRLMLRLFCITQPDHPDTYVQACILPHATKE